MVSISTLALTYYVQPVKGAANLVILPTDSGYLNEHSWYYVVGEVENTGDTPVTDIYVNTTFYNITGGIVGEISQPTKLSIILPGRISPFDVTLMSTVESLKVYNYTVRIVQYSATEGGHVGLTILSNRSLLDSNGFHVNGTIKNIGTQSTTFTRVIATFYNETGHALAVVLNYSYPSFLPVNQTAPFEISLNTSAASKVDHYALEAESYDYELVPEFGPMALASTVLMLFTTVGLVLKRFLKEKRASRSNGSRQKTRGKPKAPTARANRTQRQGDSQKAGSASTLANVSCFLSFSCPSPNLCSLRRFPIQK
jgi:hypothetical protein